MSLDFERARFNMVECQVRTWEVLDQRVLDVLRQVKREDYVPARYRKLAFADVQIPLEQGEVMMKPVVEGRMLQALQLAPESCVFEIGTGSGFVTACLGQLAREAPAMEAVLITRLENDQFQEESLFETDLPYLAHAAPRKRFAV